MIAQADSQKRVDAMADQRTDLSEKYRDSLRQSASLRLYIQQLRAQIKSQQDEMTSVQNESHEIERTSVEILPLMQKMLDTLDQFVALDVPFLADDRKARIEKLKEMMPRADVTVSEKYRRIVEAYQVEVEFGRTIESYSGVINGKTVDFLRVGRVALMYQTPDAQETGYWDVEKKQWVVDDHYRDGVAEGLKVAKKQTSPDLLIVPVLAATKGAH
jgi:seryl-tRNA synthetase